MSNLFKPNKFRVENGSSSNQNGASPSLSNSKENISSPVSSTGVGVTEPNGTNNSSNFWRPSNTHTFPTTTKSYPKTANSDSILPSPALQAPYERGAESADTATKQIVDDKAEVVHIIANYAIEPLEMLHLVDRWIQQLLGEFYQQRDSFKHRLSDKWQKEELSNIQYDNNNHVRDIYAAYKQLQTALDTTLSREAFEDLNNFLRNVDQITTDEMKEKFNSIASEYSKILRCLEYVDRKIKSGVIRSDNYINEIENNLSKLKQLNNKPSHTICILGLEKAGKSTFINALLGYELLPAASERCTQVRTVLKPPIQDGDQQLYATVKFYDDQEFRVFHDKMPKKTDETEDQLQARKTQVSELHDRLRTKFPEEQFRINNLNDITRERTTIHQKLHEYITGELYVNIIKEIAIYTDRLPGRNYELLDVPGFDSPIKEHRDAGLEAVKNADAFLFLTSGQNPSLTQPQIQLLNEIRQNHFEAMQRAFGIITKLDLCQTSDNFKEHYRNSYNELIDKGFQPEHIFVTCSRLQLLDRNCEEYRIIDSKIRNFGDGLNDGFERSKEALNRFIEFELPKTHLKQLIDIGRMRLVRPVSERIDQIHEKQLLPANLADMSIDDYIKQQKIESWDRVYDEKIFKPAFAQANSWHGKIITKERALFAEKVKEHFHNSFLDRTHDFLKSTHPIEQIMLETYGYSKLQLNVHPTDNQERERLSFELEKVIDETSNVLAEYLYHHYVCGFEDILNAVCPHLKDLYRPKLTLEKCLNETHALILRVARPIIMATLRYSHLDLPVKHDAIKELIYIAPIVASNIAHNQKQGQSSLAEEIEKIAKELNGLNDLTTLIIKTLFK
ncbi:hypothetical protein I4U23_015671 [Adineta vaga]|nr:hypothetical protein I4U23_015671 [Adineta vaga]